MNSSQGGFFLTSCTGCGKAFRLAKSHLGKLVKCKHCQAVWKASPPVAGAGAAPSDISELTGTDVNNVQNPPNSQANVSNSTFNGAGLDDEAAWIGRKLGRFQIVDFLGKGAMGRVFRAHDPDLKRDVALKILAQQFIRTQKKTYRLEQFIREARSAARLSHPNTVTVYEIGQDQGWFFIAMELIEGKTLLDLVIRKKKRLPFEAVCEIIAQAADALSAAHKLGIIHRDIKPSNLMFTKEGRVKVADFGLAQLADAQDDFELPTKAVGTPYWMSPEQCRGQTAVPQSDIYALGALLFFSLTGEVPFRGKTKREILSQHLNTPVPDPRQYRKDIPESLVRIIQRAMSKNPAERQADAAEMGIALRQVANMFRQSQMAERWGHIPGGSVLTDKKPASRLRGPLALVALVLILGGVGFFGYLKFKPAVPPPTPPVIIDNVSVTKIPVYVIKNSFIYHAAGCPLLKDESRDKLMEFASDKDAETQGFMQCRYCENLLRQQRDQAKYPTPTTQP